MSDRQGDLSDMWFWGFLAGVSTTLLLMSIAEWVGVL